jgi:Cu/Ag efflux protein CusF
MKKSLVLMMSVVAVVALVSAGFSATQKSAVQKVLVMKGKVSAVDNTVGTVTLAGKKGDVVFTTDTNTQVTMGKEAKTLADVKAGDVVTIKYKNVDGKKLAITIQLPAPVAEKKEKK